MPVIFPYSKPDVTVGHAVHACISPPELYVPTPHCAHVILIPLPDTYAPGSARNVVDGQHIAGKLVGAPGVLIGRIAAPVDPGEQAFQISRCLHRYLHFLLLD